MGSKALLTCHICDQAHGTVSLGPGESARCIRCGALLSKGSRLGPDAPFALSVAGIILAAPAALLPFVSAGKLGNERVCHLFTGVASLWGDGMRALAVLVLLCGALLPAALLCSLAAVCAPTSIGLRPAGSPVLRGAIRILGDWAIPEVQVLAVLVALAKLGSLLDVSVGPDFWCYCAMTLCLLLSQHSFEFELTPPSRPMGGRDAPAPP